MKLSCLAFACVVLWSVPTLAGTLHHDGWKPEAESVEPVELSADRLAVARDSQSAVASGHVYAVSRPYSLRGDYMERDAAGVMRFAAGTTATTCTNAVGHTHWGVEGEVEFKADDYVLLRHAWLSIYELPILYFPYMYYPLDTDCGFSWMPGYMGRWGVFLLTKYTYHLLGDPDHDEGSWWLRANTRLDVRQRYGAAVGEDFFWNLGDFGAGSFSVYYAWDTDAKNRFMRPDWNGVWSSPIDENRYVLSFKHDWQASERDRIHMKAAYVSDYYFNTEFGRDSVFSLGRNWAAYPASGVFWEHLESDYSFGVEAAGRLTDFYALTERLPEVYFDVNPRPIGLLGLNYETQNHLGWLRRRYATYDWARGAGYGPSAGLWREDDNISPGRWANYDAVRLDTYHRLTRTFRTLGDVLAVSPRIGYHGTYWNHSGEADVYGKSPAAANGEMLRSIGEVGATFAARGSGWINERWSHMVEPYLDVLLQEAWFSGGDGNSRPYVFDSIDASQTWEDQYAGRGRALPYSYYGVTPGLRNAWSVVEESGNLRQVVDLDVYGAFAFGATSFEGDPSYGNFDAHKLAERGKRNYGKSDCYVVPGARLRWRPSTGMTLMTRAEYDTDSDNLALADLTWHHAISPHFNYTVNYGLRHHRFWDYSSTPYSTNWDSDIQNQAYYQMVRVDFEWHPLEWLAFSPYIRWDFQEREVDRVGFWVDYMTDCLGFRFEVSYENEFTSYNRYVYEDDWSFGFYVYLRAMGTPSADVGIH